MAQHDYNLENAAGAAFRADLNSALVAVATNNSGSTPPATTFAGMWWLDTANNLLKLRNETNSGWITVAKRDGAGWTPYRQGTALGTAAVQDDARYVHRASNLSDLTNAGTARGNLGLGTASLRAAENTLTNGSNLPDGAAVKAHVDAAMHVKAWVNFDGTGVVSIRESFNVSSITDNGTGDYTVNFATALADANYVMSGMAQSFNTGDPGSGIQPVLKSSSFSSTPTLKTTTQCTFLVGTSNRFDVANVSIIFVR